MEYYHQIRYLMMYDVFMVAAFFMGLLLGLFVGKVFLPKKQALFSHEEAVAFGKKGREAQRVRALRRKERILAFAVKNGRIVNNDAEDMFCISDSTAYRYLRELVGEKKLEKHGEGRETYYTPVLK